MKDLRKNWYHLRLEMKHCSEVNLVHHLSYQDIVTHLPRALPLCIPMVICTLDELTRPIPSKRGGWRGFGTISSISKCNRRFIVLSLLHKTEHLLHYKYFGKIQQCTDMQTLEICKRHLKVLWIWTYCILTHRKHQQCMTYHFLLKLWVCPIKFYHSQILVRLYFYMHP